MARAGGRPGLESRYAIAALVLHAGPSPLGARWLGWPCSLLGGLAAATIATVRCLGEVDCWPGLAPGRAVLEPLSRVRSTAAWSGAGA